MKLFLVILALAVSLHAEDAPKPPTVEELTSQLTEQKQENERLTKLLNAYAQKYQRCDQELTLLQTLGAQPQQQQARPPRSTAPKETPKK